MKILYFSFLLLFFDNDILLMSIYLSGSFTSQVFKKDIVLLKKNFIIIQHFEASQTTVADLRKKQ